MAETHPAHADHEYGMQHPWHGNVATVDKQSLPLDSTPSQLVTSESRQYMGASTVAGASEPHQYMVGGVLAVVLNPTRTRMEAR